MHFKIIALTLFLAFSSNHIVADDWPEKECKKLSGYVGLLSAASAGLQRRLIINQHSLIVFYILFQANHLPQYGLMKMPKIVLKQ